MKHCTPTGIALAVSGLVLLSGCGVSDNLTSPESSEQQSLKQQLAETLQKPPAQTAPERMVKQSHKPMHQLSQDISMVEKKVIKHAAPISQGIRAATSSLSDSARSKSMLGLTYSGIQMHPAYDYFDADREQYQSTVENSVHLTAETPVSTFSIDVDTGSYSNVRRFINNGNLPRQNAVRVEELVNYFNYDYPQPDTADRPFLITTEMAPTPWNSSSQLLHIGIKGYDVDRSSLPNANLVFLVDVSGSMNSPQKLGLLKQSLKLIVQKMRAEDRISIAVYAGASGVVLDGESGSNKAKIFREIDQFQAGGSTNGAAGIQLAYQLAQSHFIKGGINRVLLATDGDFNVGTVNFEALIGMVETRRQSGISLTTLGFGQGNYNDHLMEQLADKGNGNYAYIDTLQEARKVLVEEMASTLHTIAKDVKIQVEFNPSVVQEYRLIGYENRALKREDFNNDKVDAGEVGAGHSVTALYEVTLVGQKGQQGHLIDPLRYGKTTAVTNSVKTEQSNFSSVNPDEVAFVKLRYKKPSEDASLLMTHPVQTSSIKNNFDQASDRFKFAAAVAGFGQILSGGNFTRNFTLQNVESIGVSSKGSDVSGYRSEFVNLVRLAKELQSKG